jgi:hypothetical protein
VAGAAVPITLSLCAPQQQQSQCLLDLPWILCLDITDSFLYQRCLVKPGFWARFWSCTCKVLVVTGWPAIVGAVCWWLWCVVCGVRVLPCCMHPSFALGAVLLCLLWHPVCGLRLLLSVRPAATGMGVSVFVAHVVAHILWVCSAVGCRSCHGRYFFKCLWQVAFGSSSCCLSASGQLMAWCVATRPSMQISGHMVTWMIVCAVSHIVMGQHGGSKAALSGVWCQPLDVRVGRCVTSQEAVAARCYGRSDQRLTQRQLLRCGGCVAP